MKDKSNTEKPSKDLVAKENAEIESFHPFVIVEYIRIAIDSLCSTKPHSTSSYTNNSKLAGSLVDEIFSPKVAHHPRFDSVHSERSSDIGSIASCPPTYEKLIVELEADVRKHIRNQQ
jgi:hypothetical protein